MLKAGRAPGSPPHNAVAKSALIKSPSIGVDGQKRLTKLLQMLAVAGFDFRMQIEVIRPRWKMWKQLNGFVPLYRLQ